MKDQDLRNLINLFDEFETNPLKKRKTFGMLMLYVDQIEPLMEELKSLNKVIEAMSGAMAMLIKENTALKEEQKREREKVDKLREKCQMMEKIMENGRN